nr:hypothetical protein [Xenorhabdus indica]
MLVRRRPGSYAIYSAISASLGAGGHGGSEIHSGQPSSLFGSVSDSLSECLRTDFVLRRHFQSIDTGYPSHC